MAARFGLKERRVDPVVPGDVMVADLSEAIEDEAYSEVTRTYLRRFLATMRAECNRTDAALERAGFPR
jgi:hypothetical protein